MIPLTAMDDSRLYMMKQIFGVFLIMITCFVLFFVFIKKPEEKGVLQNPVPPSQAEQAITTVKEKKERILKVQKPEISKAEKAPTIPLPAEKSPESTNQPTSEVPITKELKYTVARTALKLVGVDREAEEYWISAINDPELSANERRDLIEDLNQDGFSEPDNPTTADLPLIFNRLQLISELEATAMDQVNADAFKEAYKDLEDMYSRLTRTEVEPLPVP